MVGWVRGVSCQWIFGNLFALAEFVLFCGCLRWSKWTKPFLLVSIFLVNVFSWYLNHTKHAVFKKCVYLVLVIFGSLSKNPKINVSHSFIAYDIFQVFIYLSFQYSILREVLNLIFPSHVGKKKISLFVRLAQHHIDVV